MSECSYFHGGAGGLKVGDLILPATETRCLDSTAALAKRYGWKEVARDDRVYVTTVYMAAVMYAVARPRPTVYRVAPIGALVADPDCSQPGLSFECERATVLEVLKPKRAELKAWRAHFFGKRAIRG